MLIIFFFLLKLNKYVLIPILNIANKTINKILNNKDKTRYYNMSLNSRYLYTMDLRLRYI